MSQDLLSTLIYKCVRGTILLGSQCTLIPFHYKNRNPKSDISAARLWPYFISFLWGVSESLQVRPYSSVFGSVQQNLRGPCTSLCVFDSSSAAYSVTTDLTMTYFSIAVGLPTLVVAVSLVTTGGQGYADAQSCWLSTRNHILWAFVVPALLIVSVSLYLSVTVMMCPQLTASFVNTMIKWSFFFQQGNIVVFALVIYSMLSSHRLRKEPLTRRFQRGLKASLVLLPLLGISWSFGVLTMTSDKIAFNYIFAIFNSLQGFFIFIFHCVFNKQVRFHTNNVKKCKLIYC